MIASRTGAGVEASSASSASSAHDPLRIGPVSLRNRLISLPVGMHGFVDGLGRPTADFNDIYRERARGGYSLVYTQVVIFDEDYAHRGDLLLTDDADVPAFQVLADSIRAEGAVSGIQLTSHWQSDFPYRMSELSTREIEAMIDGYERAAARAVEAGFDVVNLQASHGWPLQRFLSPLYNDRTDRYRDGLDVVRRIGERVRAVAAESCAVSWRLSADEFAGSAGLEPRTVRDEIVPVLVAAGADLVDLSLGRGPIEVNVRDHLAAETTYSTAAESLMNFAEFGGRMAVPISVRGRVVRREDVELALRYGDLVGIGRQAVADPRFARKVLGLDDDPIVTCIGCNHCIRTVVNQGKPIKCAVNWSFGRPGAVRLPSQPTPARRVLVIGGGVSGMTAAIELARSGAAVDLRERAPRLGGRIADLQAMTELNLSILGTLTDRLAAGLVKDGVRVSLDDLVDVETEAARGEWSAIVDATGAASLRHDEVDAPAALAEEILTDIPSSVVVLSRRGEGAELAVELASRGARVALLDESASGLATVYDYDGKRAEALAELFERWGIRLETEVGSVTSRPVGRGVELHYRVGSAHGTIVTDRLVSFGRATGGEVRAPHVSRVDQNVEYERVGRTPVMRIGDAAAALGVAEAIDSANRAARTVMSLSGAPA